MSDGVIVRVGEGGAQGSGVGVRVVMGGGPLFGLKVGAAGMVVRQGVGEGGIWAAAWFCNINKKAETIRESGITENGIKN